jgi:L-fucose mutarotase
MLKGINPLLSADVLFLLARMGHGDDLAIVDANHPAETIASQTVSQTLVRLPRIAVDRLVEAILTVFPIDDFTKDPIRFMQVVGKADATPEAVGAMEIVVRRHGFAGEFHRLERFDFYAAGRQSFGIIQCGDARPYANILIRKGVVFST